MTDAVAAIPGPANENEEEDGDDMAGLGGGSIGSDGETGKGEKLSDKDADNLLSVLGL